MFCTRKAPMDEVMAMTMESALRTHFGAQTGDKVLLQVSNGASASCC